jgi:hypothetical protein
VIDAPPLHPDLVPLSFLLGTWEGEGKGEYPTIAPFHYREEVRFWHIGKPYLAYAQRTWAVSDGRPLHAETGFWRLPGGLSAVEVVFSHPNGQVEIEEGTLDGQLIELTSTAVAHATTAKQVDGLHRVLEVDGDALVYRLAMAAVGEPMTHHLAATLVRTQGSA